MAGILRNAFTEGMKKQLYTYFWESYDETPPKYTEFFEVVNSDAAYEQFTSAIGLGELLEKPEDEDIQYDAPMESYTIICKNRSFARGVKFSYEAIQDSKQAGNLLQNSVGTWGGKLNVTKEKFYAKFFNYGAYSAGNDVFNNTISGLVTDSSGTLIYDGKALFATDHPDKVGGTYSNFESAYSLTHDNIKTVYTTFHVTNAKDERGDVVELQADTLLIPPALLWTAREILESTLIPGSMDNDTNVLKSILTPVTWRYLTDTDGWFMIQKGKGLMATNREEVSLDFWQDEQNKRYYASCFTRFGGCVTNWRYMFANNISTS